MYRLKKSPIPMIKKYIYRERETTSIMHSLSVEMKMYRLKLNCATGPRIWNGIKGMWIGQKLTVIRALILNIVHVCARFHGRTSTNCNRTQMYVTENCPSSCTYSVQK